MVSLFAFPQPLNGPVIEGIDGKMKSADPFDRYDLSG